MRTKERGHTAMEKYEELKMEVIVFDAGDIVTASIPDDNEGPMNDDF